MTEARLHDLNVLQAFQSGDVASGMHELIVTVRVLQELLRQSQAALFRAAETIQALHGPEAWDIYKLHSPEMKQINSALQIGDGARC